MTLATADTLMGIFGYRRVFTAADGKTAEYECLLEGGALQDRIHPTSGKLIASKPVKLKPHRARKPND